MFRSAILKLTGWYIAIIMTISLIFSIAIFSITTHEVGNRLEALQSRLEQYGQPIPPPTDGSFHNSTYTEFRARQNSEATLHLFWSLVYVNLFILIAGGAGSYLLARRTLKDIEEAHEAQSRFTSDASHELRTPLAVMKTELEVMLRDKNSSKSELRETLESTLEEVDKLSRMSKTLLQLSKVDQSDLELEEVDIELVARDVVSRQNQPPKRISITPSGNIPHALANTDSIEELFMILVDNALKYSPDKSLVQIKLSPRNGKVCLEIINTGQGISEEDLPLIFDRFYRSDVSRTNGLQSGYGLGLSLAKKIVEIHHGELSATSALNHATTFTVLLPPYKQSPAKSQK